MIELALLVIAAHELGDCSVQMVLGLLGGLAAIGAFMAIVVSCWVNATWGKN